MKTHGRIRMSLALACAAAMTVSVGAARADLIINGSFEEPLVPVGGYTNFLAGATGITGWTIVGIDSTVVNTAFTQNGITFQAQNGNQWIDLAGIRSNSMTSGVKQVVVTTPGQAYELNFYVGSATDNIFFFPTTVDLSIDGGPRVSYLNPTAPTNHLDWKQFTVQFTAANSATALTFFNGDASNNYNTSLDNVSLRQIAAVPEPGSIALLVQI